MFDLVLRAHLKFSFLALQMAITSDVRSILLVGSVRNLDGNLDRLEVFASYALGHPSCSPLLLDTRPMVLRVE